MASQLRRRRIEHGRSCGQKTGRVATPLATGIVGRRVCPWRRRPAIASFDASRPPPACRLRLGACSPPPMKDPVGTSIGSHGRTSSFNADPLSHSRNRKHPSLERRSVRRGARLRSTLTRYRIPGIGKKCLPGSPPARYDHGDERTATVAVRQPHEQNVAIERRLGPAVW